MVHFIMNYAINTSLGMKVLILLAYLQHVQTGHVRTSLWALQEQ